MIDEKLFTITEQTHKKLKEMQSNPIFNPTNLSYEEFMERRLYLKKPFFDFASHCMNAFEYSPYNPANQPHRMTVYDQDDTLTKEEFQQLPKYHQVEYMLYHRWKKGEVTREQLKDFDWFELFVFHR